MKLLYSNCVPINTYACAAKQFHTAELKACEVAVNNAYRKIFNYSRNQSVSDIQLLFGKSKIEEFFQVAKRKFLNASRNSNNSVIRCISNVAV